MPVEIKTKNKQFHYDSCEENCHIAKKKNSYHCDESAGDELEIAQVIWIDVRRRVDLKAVVVFVCQLQVSKNSGWDLALRVTGVGTIPCKVFCNISESSCVTPQ